MAFRLRPKPAERGASRRGCETCFLHALGAQTFRYEEGKLKRLIGVEPRIAMRVVAARQILFRNRLRAAQAFGDVLPRHLEMYTARMRPLGAVHFEECPHFFDNSLEGAGLEAALRCDGVAVHGIARPDDGGALAPQGPAETQQFLANSVGAKAADERDASRLVFRIENREQPQQFRF